MTVLHFSVLLPCHTLVVSVWLPLGEPREVWQGSKFTC